MVITLVLSRKLFKGPFLGVPWLGHFTVTHEALQVFYSEALVGLWFLFLFLGRSVTLITIVSCGIGVVILTLKTRQSLYLAFLSP